MPDQHRHVLALHDQRLVRGAQVALAVRARARGTGRTGTGSASAAGCARTPRSEPSADPRGHQAVDRPGGDDDVVAGTDVQRAVGRLQPAVPAHVDALVARRSCGRVKIS